MRLSENERQAIVETVGKLDPNAEVYLYGSRTDDTASGGDIDLLVLSSILGFTDKVDILIDIKNRIGEQKIDLSFKTAAEAQSDAFFRDVMKKAVRL